MKTKKYLLIALVAMVCVAFSAEAVVNIQNVGAGARSMALGNSFVAVADNPDAVFENPAGLMQIEKKQIAYTNVSLFFGGIDGDNLGQHVLAYVQPMGSRMALGLGFEQIGSDLMNERGGFLSLGFGLSKNLNLGLNVKYLMWSVGEIPNNDPLSKASMGGLGVDLGVLWKSPVQGAKVGLLLKNLNQPNMAKEKVRKADGSEDTDAGALPMDLHLGVAYQVNPQSMVTVQYVVRDVTAESVSMATGEMEEDGVTPKMADESSKTAKLLVGGETRLAEGLMLRAGGSKIFEDDVSGDVNAGLGYRWNTNMIFDYSYHIPLELRETGGAHRFSFGYEF